MTKKRVRTDIDAVLNFIVCIGAAVVILGALAKLVHHYLADIALTIGLFTEATIFVIYAFLPPEKDAAKPAETREKTEVPDIKKPIEELTKTLKNIYKGA